MFGKPIHPLIGLVRCAECGSPFVIHKTVATAHGTTRYLSCDGRHKFANHCGNGGQANLADLEAAIQNALTGFFSDARLAAQHYKRVLAAIGDGAPPDDTVAATTARCDLAAAERDLGRIQAAILRGLDTETTRQMILDAEARRQAAQDAITEAAKPLAPAMRPPADILRGVTSQYQQDRKAAYRRLLAEVRLTANRPAGKRKVVQWTAEILPRPEAGITGLPTRLTFGQGRLIVGHSAPGTHGHIEC